MDFLQITVELLKSFGITFLLFLLTLVFALPLGLLISFCTMSKNKVISALFKGIVWIIRGIPLMLLIFIIYYLPGLLGSSSNIFNELDIHFTIQAGLSKLLWYGRFIAVLIAFTINYACYFSEIYRGGIQSISKGQYEAGAVLGLTKNQIFTKIVFKQVIKRIVPPMSNEIITLIKDTALANAIAIPEIILCAKNMAAESALVWPLFYTSVFYLLFVGILTIVFHRIEKKLDYIKV